MTVAIVSMTPEEEARDVSMCEAHPAAHQLYGDDPALVLAALTRGPHPLQRVDTSRR